MRRALDALTGLCRFGAAISFLVLIAAVTVQVVSRTTVGGSPVWTEELTRFALLFLIAFGAGPAFRNGELVGVDVLSEGAPGRWPWLLRLFCAVATVALCVALIQPAWRFSSIGAFQTAPTLGVSMFWIHASVLLLLGSLGVFAAMRTAGMIAGSDKGLPDREEEAP
jgi:TRAP-type transport system small permease protein